MLSSETKADTFKVMTIIWENEKPGQTFDDLFEYPYSIADREKIIKRLRAAATQIVETLSGA